MVCSNRMGNGSLDSGISRSHDPLQWLQISWSLRITGGLVKFLSEPRNPSIRRSNASSFSSLSVSGILHSQTERTDQPRRRNLCSFDRSRSLFLFSFGIQYSEFAFGILPSLHECPCQKHPFTWIIVLYFGRTISGHPGRPRTCNRKRNPRR